MGLCNISRCIQMGSYQLENTTMLGQPYHFTLTNYMNMFQVQIQSVNLRHSFAMSLPKLGHPFTWSQRCTSQSHVYMYIQLLPNQKTPWYPLLHLDRDGELQFEVVLIHVTRMFHKKNYDSFKTSYYFLDNAKKSRKETNRF